MCSLKEAELEAYPKSDKLQFIATVSQTSFASPHSMPRLAIHYAMAGRPNVPQGRLCLTMPSQNPLKTPMPPSLTGLESFHDSSLTTVPTGTCRCCVGKGRLWFSRGKYNNNNYYDYYYCATFTSCGKEGLAINEGGEQDVLIVHRRSVTDDATRRCTRC